MKRNLALGGRFLLITILVVIVTSTVSSWLALHRAEAIFAPALESKARIVGLSVNSLLEKLLGYGVPFERMRGLDEELGAVIKTHPEVSRIAIHDAAGTQLYAQSAAVAASADQKSDVVLPILVDGKRLGTIIVTQNRDYVARQSEKNRYDVITVVIVTLLMATELLFFLITFTIIAPVESLQTLMRRVSEGDLTVSRPIGKGNEIDRFSHQLSRALDRLNDSYQDLLRLGTSLCKAGQQAVVGATAALGREYRFRTGPPQRIDEQRLLYVRPPLFLLIFSDSMSLAFFPLYVESLYTPVAGISRDFIIGLPISLFMLIWALSLPFAGQWSDQVGRRRSFMAGAVITAVGLVMTGFVSGMLELLLCRCVTAIGYGLVFITAQGFVTDNTSPQNRTKGMAIFLSGFFSGSLCGAAIGGILVTRIGYAHTFMLSALLSIASALFVYHFVKERADVERAPARKLRLADFKIIFSNPRFMTVTFLTAIPAKVCLTGFIYYVGPRYLKLLGNDASAAGRILMAYGLAIIIISPLSAYVADRIGHRRHFIAFGGILSGVAMLVVYLQQSLLGILAAVCLLGLSHAIGISPQLSLITALPQAPEQEVPLGTTIGIFRLTERLGNVAGPMIAATWITLFDFSGTFLVFGCYMIASTLLFMLLMGYFDRRPLTLPARGEA